MKDRLPLLCSLVCALSYITLGAGLLDAAEPLDFRGVAGVQAPVLDFAGVRDDLRPRAEFVVQGKALDFSLSGWRKTAAKKTPAAERSLAAKAPAKARHVVWVYLDPVPANCPPCERFKADKITLEDLLGIEFAVRESPYVRVYPTFVYTDRMGQRHHVEGYRGLREFCQRYNANLHLARKR